MSLIRYLDYKLRALLSILQYSDTDKLHQAGAEFPLILALIPWKHHTEIISKCETIDEATFYIKKTISENWSRTVLQRCLKANLYHNSSNAVTNFSQMLPSPQSELTKRIRLLEEQLSKEK